MQPQLITVGGLGALAVGAVLYVAFPYLSGDIKAERRRMAITASTQKRSTERVVDASNRRKQIADSLKDFDNSGKRRRRATLATRIGQAGLTWTPQGFMIGSAIAGLLLGFFAYFWSGSLLTAVAGAAAGGLGVPNWWLSFRAKRRTNKFVNEFPNAVDIIVRGIRAGLPLADCLRVIVNETSEPVKSEFRHIVESQAIGLPLGEAVERIAERVPISETSFFSIVISIQQKAGGNLSEALSNLSKVLRDRRKMRNKVKAVSSEAKASAMIIGSMPFAVGILIYITSPHYIELLWTTSTGQMMMGVGAIWMGIGIMVMKKMISFDI